MIDSRQKVIGLWLAFATFIGAGSLLGGDYTVKSIEKAPPSQFAESITKALSNQCVQLLEDGETVYEFWLRKSIPLKALPDAPGRGLSQIRETTFLGVIRSPGKRRDYRDDDLYKGLYTLRFALKPKDGNHQGTSAYDYFMALIEAGKDKAVDAIKDYDAMVDASADNTASEHPMILSLRPPSETSGELPRIVEPAPDHKSILVKCQGESGGESTDMIFEIVIEGMAVF